ncbi:putative toxin-antitoxin system toxin component, PIN family [Halochromatium glycolicum]|uniref:putative toxin-antitoxin system toxin component, PIN family n=1 Tax=Halochromatium glycolicum TaxID=85075 RepID=UPI001F5B332D|nr:putative toxin-antitoxin system toxin component, PIN family [Halochromatium glycolicum]
MADRVELVEPDMDLAVCRDPNDNAILELAVAGQATAIVAGDPDLLALHPFEGIPILSPRRFTETLMRRR